MDHASILMIRSVTQAIVCELRHDGRLPRSDRMPKTLYHLVCVEFGPQLVSNLREVATYQIGYVAKKSARKRVCFLNSEISIEQIHPDGGLVQQRLELLRPKPQRALDSGVNSTNSYLVAVCQTTG